MRVDQLSESLVASDDDASLATGRFGRAGLALEVLVLYVRVRWLVLRRGEVPAVSILRRGVSEERSAEPDRARIRGGRRFGRAVVRVLRLLPADNRCLMRSLVLTGMLARRGVYGKVVIGVRPGPSFGAHAWVEVDGQPLLYSDEATYQRLAEI